MTSAVYAGPRCPHCRVTLDLEHLFSGMQSCPTCHGVYEAIRFTPPARRTHVARVAEAGPAGASPCGTHPANASVASCERCGVFMCGLCRIDLEQQTLCPECFERLSADGTLRSTQVTLVSHHRIAVVSLLAGILTWPLMSVFGIAAAYLCLRELRRKRRMQEPEGRGAIWTTFGLAVVETAAGIAMLASMVAAFRGGS